MVTIYGYTGNVILTTEVGDGSEVFRSLMGEHYISLEFYTAFYYDIPVGSYILYEGATYALMSAQLPERSGAGWKYALQFNAPEMHMQRYLICYTGQGGREMTFAITSYLATVAGLLATAMNDSAVNPNPYAWVIGDCERGEDSDELATVSFNGETVFDAATLIADTFDTEWWAEMTGETVTQDLIDTLSATNPNLSQKLGKEIIRLHFKKAESEESVDFEEGGIIDTMTPQSGDSSQYGTRFWCFGSTRNLTASYNTVSGGEAINAISEPRLRPVKKDSDGTITVQNPILAKNGEIVSSLSDGEIIDKTVFFEDEYPKNDTPITAVDTVRRKLENAETLYDQYVIFVEDANFDGDSSIIAGETLKCKFVGEGNTLVGWEFDLIYKKEADITPTTESASGTRTDEGLSSVDAVYVPLGTVATGSSKSITVKGKSVTVGEITCTLTSGGTLLVTVDSVRFVNVDDEDDWHWGHYAQTAIERTSNSVSKITVSGIGDEYTYGSKTYRIEIELQYDIEGGSDSSNTVEVSYSGDPSKLKYTYSTGSAKCFEVVAQNLGDYYDTESGETLPLLVPNKNQAPAVGDTIVLENVIPTSGMITDAEEHLADTATEYARKNSSDTNLYECDTNIMTTSDGAHDYDIGQKVNLINAHYFSGGSRSSRIREYTKNFIFPYKATYTVGDNRSYSKSTSLTEAQDDAEYATRLGIASTAGIKVIRSSDDLPSDDTMVYSSLKVDELVSAAAASASVSVTDENPTLAVGEDAATYTVGTVSGTPLQVTVPSTDSIASALTDGGYKLTDTTYDLSKYALTASLAKVATSGLYSDLTRTPTIPANTSDLNNDSNFATTDDITDAIKNLGTAGAVDDGSYIYKVGVNASGNLYVEAKEIAYPTLTDLLGSNDIGGETTPVYWNGAIGQFIPIVMETVLGDYITQEDLEFAIEALDSQLFAASGYYITGITQIDGVINAITTAAIPTKLSDLTNDSGYIASTDLKTITLTVNGTKYYYHPTGSGFTCEIALATTSAAGLMSAADKTSLDNLASYFELVTLSDGTQAIHALYGLYTDSFLSAHGADTTTGSSTGGLDEAAMWEALQSTTGTYAETQIAAAHIPTLTQDKIQGLSSNLSSLNSSINSLKASVSTNTNNISSLTTRVGTAETNIATLQGYFTSGVANSAAKVTGTLTFTGSSTGTYNGSSDLSIAIPTVPTSLKNPYKLTFTGGSTVTYDGSAAKSVAIPTSLKSPYALTINLADGTSVSYDGSATKTADLSKYATQEFVNSSIATNTATFRGTYESTDDLPLSGDISDLKANDYAFIIAEDSNGNPEYQRYKYSSTDDAWAYEYTLNNSSFTAEQWAAVQSGITSTLVTKLQGIATGAQVNVIESVKLNGTALSVSSKAVNVNAATSITVPTGLSAASLTSAGKIAITYASGYEGFTTALKSTINAMAVTAGSTTKPIYFNAGVPTALSSTVGSGTKPVYLNAGTITASSSTVGSASKPIYMSSGTLTACSSTVGGAAKPVYMSSGTITACSSTVGGTAKPVYMNSGTITALSSTVGSTDIPVYMNAGTITKCNYNLNTISLNVDTLLSWFGIDDDGNIYVKKDSSGNARGFYSYGFISARGVDTTTSSGSGGLDEAAMWEALQATTGTYASTEIASVHIPTLSMDKVQGLNNLSSSVTTLQSTISAMDATINAGSGNYIYGITQVDGKITGYSSAAVPTITSLMGSSAVGSTSAYIYWTGSAWATKTLGSRAFDSTSYLPLAGGTMSGNITFASLSTTDGTASKGLVWSGGTDGASIYYAVDASDQGTLYLKMTDDNNAYIKMVGYNTSGTVAGTIRFIPYSSAIIASTFTGLASKATADGSGNTITSTYIKALSVSGTTITYTYGDGTTKTITTQDTTPTYSNHYHPSLTNVALSSLSQSDYSLRYFCGQYTIGTSTGNAYEGSSANANLLSFPTGGAYTDRNKTVANIQTVRLYWNSSYFTDILTSPNYDSLWWRSVVGGTAYPWYQFYHSGNFTVSNSAPTLSLGTTSTIGTVGGTALTVTMPTASSITSALNSYVVTMNTEQTTSVNSRKWWHMDTSTLCAYWTARELSWAYRAVSYIKNVILLCPVPTTVNACVNYQCNGTFYLTRNGANKLEIIDVYINTCYNSVYYSINYTGEYQVHPLVRCTYGGTDYYAVQICYQDNRTDRIRFIGHSTNTSLPKVVGYYNTNTSTVLDSEINDSITETLSTSVITSVYHLAKTITDTTQFKNNVFVSGDTFKWGDYSVVRNTGTWGISVTGNAATATTLATARTINGTSFNGSANITTSYWGTARTLTIGSTGKSVNGSAAVSWSLAEILGSTAVGNAYNPVYWNGSSFVSTGCMYNIQQEGTFDADAIISSVGYCGVRTMIHDKGAYTSVSNLPSTANTTGGVTILEVAHGNYHNQLLFDYGNGELYSRAQYYSSSSSIVWNSWRRIVDSSNFTSIVTKLGTSTVGSSTKPIYLNAGVPTALSTTVGSGTKPVYLNAGTITASSSTVGSASKPIYMSSGTLTACSSTVGSSTVPVYMNSGTITSCTINLYDLDYGLEPLFASYITPSEKEGWYRIGSLNNRQYSYATYSSVIRIGRQYNYAAPETYLISIQYSWGGQCVFNVLNKNVASQYITAIRLDYSEQNFYYIDIYCKPHSSGQQLFFVSSIANFVPQAPSYVSAASGTTVECQLNYSSCSQIIRNTTAEASIEYVDSSGIAWVAGSKTGSYFVWNNSISASVMTITSAGRMSLPYGLSIGYANTSYKLSVNEAINNGWWRSYGSTGWYSETYGGGIYCTDTTYVRIYNNRSLYTTGGLYGGTATITGAITCASLTASGEITANYSSDSRLKTNIDGRRDYRKALLRLGSVVDYEYTEEARKRQGAFADGNRHTGIIYQNALKAGITGLCKEDKDGYGSINPLTPDLIFTVTGALQQTIRKQDRQEQEIKRLKKRVKELEEQVNRLSA